MRSRTSLIIGQNESELPELSALDLDKIAAFDLGYTPASTNINQFGADLVTICRSIRSQIISIMGLSRLE